MARVDINIANCDGEEYVLFPACCYNGNRFKAVKRAYPPVFTAEEASIDIETTITDVPRLEKDGSGKIQVTTGDVSTPCVGVFNKNTKKAVFVFTVQEIDGENIGLAYEKGCISITYPACREVIYRWPMMHKNTEVYAEKDVEIPYKMLELDCTNIEEFFEIFFNNRKIMGLEHERPEVISDEEQFEIQKNKFNNMNWTGEYYDLDTKGQWQPGWCGGAISSYPLMKLGGKLEYERGVKTLEHLFNNQSPSGLFYGFNDKRGDAFGREGQNHWLFIRKSADALYFAFKHFSLMDTVPQQFIDGARKLADRFVAIWEKYGQLGQFIDADSGDIIVGGSTAGAIVPAALVEAYEFFGDKKYLTVAEESADFMYNRDAKNGYTTGGPGEILQGPDSESAALLLESIVLLYENTKNEKWLSYAIHTANLCSSWVVSYNYKFPEGSEFDRLGMKTVGSVFANVQNKHSAPGICTLSGYSLYKIYEWTNNEKYKELYEDITLTISQYMSTEKRPIYSWDVPKDAMPEGFICERVNMSDWESKRCIGGVFNGSCWCEVSNLLALADRMK